MSNLTEELKNNDMERLKKARTAILNATTLDDDLHKEVAELQLFLHEMERRTSGEIQQTVKRALQEIQRFWMHDATRSEVCKWVQTVICELNTQK